MNKRITASDLFLAFLAFLLISVSFTQTWKGLQQIFGPASFIIALVLSLLLLFLCWMIRNAKIDGKSTTSLVGIYVFIASFCFIANFNALYTKFMTTDIFTNELREISQKYNDLETNVEGNLSYKYSKETKQKIETIKQQLIQQIKDPGNKGIGTRAQGLIKDLEKTLGQRVDLLTPEGNDYEDLAIRMGKQIDGMESDLSPEEKNLKTEMNNAVFKWNKKIQELLAAPKADQDANSQKLIDETLSDYNKLGNRAVNILGKEKIKFEPMVSHTQEVGKIGYAFNHAIKNFGIYQFVVLAGCILLDFVIVIIILLVTSPEDNNSHKGSVFTSKKGKTLLPKN